MVLVEPHEERGMIINKSSGAGEKYIIACCSNINACLSCLPPGFRDWELWGKDQLKKHVLSSLSTHSFSLSLSLSELDCLCASFFPRALRVRRLSFVLHSQMFIKRLKKMISNMLRVHKIRSYSNNYSLGSGCAAVVCFGHQVLILQVFHTLHPDCCQAHLGGQYCFGAILLYAPPILTKDNGSKGIKE